ncbi:hypothetical protein FD724_31150 [Nostoc sp. C057]|nr:hypothetical protein FD724_31150 [Nostoc sp. C057]
MARSGNLVSHNLLAGSREQGAGSREQGARARGENLKQVFPLVPHSPCPLPYSLFPIPNGSLICVYARTTFLMISRPTSPAKVMIDSG